MAGERKEVRETFVELLYPGSLFAEDESRKVAGRDPQAVAKKYPKCFAFRFYDLITRRVVVGGQEKQVSTSRLDVSPTYYPNGQPLTVADVKRSVPKSEILVSNMEGNGWKKVVQTRCGNFQPLEKGDVILEVTHAGE